MSKFKILESQNHNFSKCQIYKMSNFQSFRFYKTLIIYQPGSRLVSNWMDELVYLDHRVHNYLRQVKLMEYLVTFLAGKKLCSVKVFPILILSLSMIPTLLYIYHNSSYSRCYNYPDIRQYVR